MGEPKSAAGPRLLQRASVEAERLAVPIGAEDHVTGYLDATVTLLEYGDYECFYCGAAETILSVVRERLVSPIRFVFRHFPLTEVHAHAELAAQAAEAAGAQGAFWQMHNWLFQHQRMLEMDQFVQQAANLGADVPRFREDIERRVYAARIQADLDGGLQSGVTGVPTFFINGVRHVGSYKPDHLVPALVAAGAEPK
jgi:protein-disulfide isomerase